MFIKRRSNSPSAKEFGRAVLQSTTLIGFVFALAGSLFAQGVPLSVTASPSQIGVGDVTDITIGISGLGDPPSLAAYDLTVQYDPALFSFSSIAFGDPTLGDQLDLSGFGTSTTQKAGPGSVEFTELSFDDPNTLDTQQASAFTLVTLQFQSLDAGTGTFSLSNPLLSDAIGSAITVGSLGTASVEVVSGPPSNTPEPYMFFPAFAGLAGFVLRRRRMRSSNV
jgi:hypothetical protein